MTTTRRLIVAALLAAFALGLLPTLVHAATNQEKLSLTQQKLEQARARIAAAKKQQKTLNGQIATLDARLTGINAELARLGDQIALVEQKLSVTQQKLDVLREQLRLKRAELERAQKKLEIEEQYFQLRIKISYKTDELSYIDVVLASADFEDLVSRMSLVEDLLSGDRDLVAQLEATRDEVREEKRVIAQKEGEVHKAVADLRDQNEQLAALRAAQQAEQQNALAARQQKQGTLAGVKQNLKLLARQEDALLAQSQALTNIINGASGGGHGTGSLVWPAGSRAQVTSPFGWRIHPILGTRRFHTGIDIGVGYGTPIHAADGGRVIYATWMSGYGNCTIVDHGGGISTLYAHQASIAVGYGATVSRGQTIGSVGSTGFSTGPHLHFEVRSSGQPVDPLGYLP
jgi:murein DD-endopeptidase MepM/ murein hydrolase activator NlpD